MYKPSKERMQQETYYVVSALWWGCHIMNMIYQWVYYTCLLPQLYLTKCRNVHVCSISVTHLWLGIANEGHAIIILYVHEVYRALDIRHNVVSNIW